MWMLFRRFKAKINTDVQKEGQEEMESCWPVAQYFYPSDLFVWFYSPIRHSREMFCGNILVFLILLYHLTPKRIIRSICYERSKTASCKEL
jgi:hypothetical protein